MKQRFEKMLLDTGIEGVGALLRHMEEGGFFESPCSRAFHLSKDGGLLEHSLNVFDYLVNTDKALGADLDYTDMVITALLHDLGKMGDHGKKLYLKSEEKWRYKYNPDLIEIPHEVRSVLIANSYIKLTEAQEHAIVYHNGPFSKLWDKKYSEYDKYPLSLLLHNADMYCSRFVEE